MFIMFYLYLNKVNLSIISLPIRYMYRFARRPLKVLSITIRFAYTLKHIASLATYR